jgi:Phytanoyl-CoA dioxygenase (PhyH)
MTAAATMPRIFSAGVEIEQIDWLTESSALRGDPTAMRDRMDRDGYLYLPGLLRREEVLAARREVTDRLAATGFIDTRHPTIDAVAAATGNSFMPDLLAKENLPLMKVLYDGPMIEFFENFLGETVRHFDFTWFRSVPPGHGTASHCDVVYMGRGERQRLFTAWTPIGDVDFQQGGLMILEGSHRHEKLRSTYGRMDVDSYCENKPNAKAWGKSWGTGGWLKGNPNQIQRSLGGRWLSGEYSAGDVLIFSIFTVHASMDNHSQKIRLSADSRYQPASSPADNRWIGPSPIAHGAAGKLGKIC